MPTFSDLQKQMNDSKHRQIIVEHLIEYIDENFRSVEGKDPEHLLLDDTKQPVPEAAFESFIGEVLVPIATECKEDADKVLHIEVAPVIPPTPEVTPEVTVDKKKSKKSKKS